MSSANEEISYESLNELAVLRFPDIAPRYQEELRAWGGEKPGPHIIFADVLTPYLVELIHNPSAENQVRTTFDFLEKLAQHPDTRIIDVIGLSVIDPLRNRCKKENWTRFLGPAMSKILKDLEYS